MLFMQETLQPIHSDDSPPVVDEGNYLPFLLLPPSQIVRRLTFLTPSLTTRLIQKKLCKYSQI